MKTVDEALGVAIEHLRPPPIETLPEWIERTIRLPEGMAQPGPVKLWPPQVEIATSIGDPDVERVTWLKAVRSGYTLLIACTIAQVKISTSLLRLLKMFHSEPAPIPRGNPMKFKPLHDRVVIRRLEGEEKTKGGIIIPDTAKEKPQEGEVVAVGPGGRDEAGKVIPIDLKPGDRVLFGKWSGTEVQIDGEELLIMKESDVMGVLEGAKASRKVA
jgi:chaperonin GroES